MDGLTTSNNPCGGQSTASHVYESRFLWLQVTETQFKNNLSKTKRTLLGEKGETGYIEKSSG